MSLLNEYNHDGIVSPCFGFIEKLDILNQYYVLYIYITRKSDHRIFMPVDGLLSKPTFQGGKLDNNGHFKQIVIPDPLHPRDVNIAHTATLTWRIYRDKYSRDYPVILKVHVGKPEYITDEIAMRDYSSDEIYASAGEQIGEIIIGSRAELYLPKDIFKLSKDIYVRNNLTIDNMEKMHDDLVGGQTKLAFF